jgi:tRNA A-37 threonylcarbamoyl transferase component Bud32
MAEAADVEDLSELVLLQPGSRFGNYIVHECIGQGAMGNVYRAQHALLEKPVALKVMDSSLLANADARARFLREGQAASAIKHPNVVDITDVGVFEGTPFLVMELLEGEDLQIYLQRRQNLSEREVATLLIPIAAALGAAHDRGVVHRDLKPSNIFLSRGPDGEVVPKILDFGISKIGQAVTSDDFESTPFNQLLGSPLYLPPEAVRASREFSPRSDQYSLGVVLYECVTGRAPFVGDSLLSLLNAISAGDFVRPNWLRPDISVAMERTILRAMNSDPALRFEHVRDLGRELLEVAGVRTQMLWGRTFGRIDLSEPLPGTRSTAPVALLRLPSEQPAAPAPAPAHQARSHRHLWLWVGAAAVIALLLPNFWAMRGFDRDPASAVAPLSRMPEPGEPRDGRSTSARREPRASAVPEGEPETETSPSVDNAPAGASNPDEGGARDDTDSARAAALERARSNRRSRLSTSSPEPRASRASLPPDARQQRVIQREYPEPSSDEVRDLFGAPAPARSSSQRGVPPALGANESPILD